MSEKVCNGVIRVPTSFVNAYLVSDANGWILVDSGLPGFSSRIRRVAADTFGYESKPQAIVLTHGHFDHSGSARALARDWSIPIFAHTLEIPYLTGKSKYPAPDPTIGGAIGFLSRFMPASGMNLGHCVRPLSDGSERQGAVPGLSDWQWLATPGHSPGHISLFRETDRTLLAGDALATMDMETVNGLLFKKRVIARAGAPFNCDWEATARSVKRLADVNPRVLAAGHGFPISGPQLASDLRHFADGFPLPHSGRYSAIPAETGENGVFWVPPKPFDPLPRTALTVAVFCTAAWLIARGRSRSRR